MDLPNIDRLREQRDDLILHLLATGYTQAEIARDAGLTQQAVSAAAKRARARQEVAA